MKYYILLAIVLLLSSTGCDTPTSSSNEVPTQEEIIVTDKNMPTITQSYAFDFGKKTLELDLDLAPEIRTYFEKQPKTFTYTGNEPPQDWETQYYDMFLSNKNDIALLQNIIEQLQTQKGDIVDLVVNFVQGGLPYDWDSFYSINSNLKYPYETLFIGKGVCSDKTLVMGKLLTLLDYKICFFAFPKANHIGVGLRVPAGYGSFGTDYAFIETTNYRRIGSVPTVQESGLQLDPTPEILFPKNTGTKVYEKMIQYKLKEQAKTQKYGEKYWSASAKQRVLLEKLDKLKRQQTDKKRDLDNAGCKGLVPHHKAEQCQKLTDEFNTIIQAYNQAVEQYNALNEKES